jgi:hypothetical protein
MRSNSGTPSHRKEIVVMLMHMDDGETQRLRARQRESVCRCWKGGKGMDVQVLASMRCHSLLLL